MVFIVSITILVAYRGIGERSDFIIYIAGRPRG